MPRHVLQSEMGEGGGSPACCTCVSHETATAIGTGFAVIPWDTVRLDEEGLSWAAGVLTIGATLNGQRALVDVCLHADTDANNRVELEISLERDTGAGWVVVRRAMNYAIRNNTQDLGGVWINAWLEPLVTGAQYRVRAKRQGSTCNTVPLACHFTLRTL